MRAHVSLTLFLLFDFGTESGFRVAKKEKKTCKMYAKNFVFFTPFFDFFSVVVILFNKFPFVLILGQQQKLLVVRTLYTPVRVECVIN